MNTKKFTILHSNDMHGDFLAEVKGAEGHLIGGLSLLSSYINRVRREEENVLYCISGDMVQGSLIDAEYKGISTIEIMNYLAPDVVTLGNHELDYGLPHLLFLEKMANFPIVNANLYIRKYNKRLMQPYIIIDKAGFDILFIGVITEVVLDSLKMDREVGSFISLEEASQEIGKICNAYRSSDIDLTVVLTHIGFEADKELAAMLRPEWGVDLIIGGHSHTILEQPAVVNDILITQAGSGTDQIGRFDIVVDDDTNRIVEWKWRLLPVDSTLATPDAELQRYIDSFKEEVDRKYNTIITKLAQPLTHPERTVETALGNLFADIVAERAGVDVALIGSGSIRQPTMGPLVTLGELRAVFPYDDVLYRFTVSGAQLRQMLGHFMHTENRRRQGECYQLSGAVRAVYDNERAAFQSLTLHGQPLDDAKPYTITVQGYHYKNAAKNLGLTEEALTAVHGPQVIATSARDVVEEYLRGHQNLKRQVEGRMAYIGAMPA